MKKGKEGVLRLKGVLMRDKSQLTDGFSELLERDLALVLNEYMELKEGEIRCSISVGESGDYEVRMQANATRLKNLPIII